MVETLTSYQRCLANADRRKQAHDAHEAAVTRRIMRAHGEPEYLIEARCQPDWWKHAEMWDEDIYDGDTEPQLHSFIEQEAIRRALRAVRRETALKAVIGRYTVRVVRLGDHDLAPVLHWTAWQWRRKLKPQRALIDDVTRFLAAERVLWRLHDQYDPAGSRIAELEAAKREAREWEARRRKYGALAALTLPAPGIQMALPLPLTPAASAADGGTRVPVRESAKAVP